MCVSEKFKVHMEGSVTTESVIFCFSHPVGSKYLNSQATW